MTGPLEVRLDAAGYGRVTILREIAFDVPPGGRFVILGGNGAGKTTTLRAISGLCAATGAVRLDGTALLRMPTHRIAATGIAHVPQGRGTLPDLTVRENLLVGGITRPRREVTEAVQQWFARFPRLAERSASPASALSGGEQQMLAIARAFLARPRIVLLDEPSLGLSPLLTSEVFQALDQIARETGVGLLIVEQNAELALGIADAGLVLENGRVVASGTAAELRADDRVRRAYLGL